MAKPVIQVDNQKFLRKMKKYQEITGKEIGQLVNNAARLCAIECLKLTAPKDKQAGEKQVASDLRNLFTIVNPTWWKEITKGTAFASGGAAIHNRSGIVWATDTQTQVSDISAAKDWHKSHKNAAGRTNRLGLLNRALVKQATYRKYLKETLKKVGIAKAGWAIVAEACNADVREPLKGIPAWVKRNMPKASGRVSALTQKEGFGFSISITNSVGYARATLDAGGESFAVNLAKKKMISMMNHAIKFEKAKEASLQQ
jgi:hypothetical protein